MALIAPAGIGEAAPTEAENKTAATKLEVDLAFLFDSLRVPLELQAAIAGLGYTELQVFAKTEDSAAAFREARNTDLRLDPQTSPARRVAAARLVTAWESQRGGPSVE